MAGSTLQIEAKNDLCHILSCLHFSPLTRIYCSSPTNPFDKAFRLFIRAQNLFNKLIVGFIVADGSVQPVGNIEAAVGDVARSSVVIS